MKGIILAGGAGTRLYPITKGVSKQLLPIYDKPMIYYPLSTLMMAGINDIVIITTPEDQAAFKKLLGNGENYGIKLTYCVQPKPEGIAQAFLIAEKEIEGEDVALILGDNIFSGPNFNEMLEYAKEVVENEHKAVVFGYPVADPERYGVAEISYDKNGERIISIIEKPANPKSNIAVTGLYFYPKNDLLARVKAITPSNRGELEITALNQTYARTGELELLNLDRGFAWLDTGTQDSLYEASAYIEAIQKRQGILIGCPEIVAYHSRWIDAETLRSLATPMMKNSYGQYLYKESFKKRTMNNILF